MLLTEFNLKQVAKFEVQQNEAEGAASFDNRITQLSLDEPEEHNMPDALLVSEEGTVVNK